MLELGVDEITLVLQPSPMFEEQCHEMKPPLKWYDMAGSIIDTFEYNSSFLLVYGNRHKEERPPHGYNRAYTYGEHNFYIAVAYHDYMKDMGIIVKFSAQSLDYYCEAMKIRVYEFLQLIEDEKYMIRLSRIDLTADYIDEGINITKIYKELMSNETGIFKECVNQKTGEILYKKKSIAIRGFIKETDIPTIYLGSVQSNSELRIYDKKDEQISKKGAKLDKALKCCDWVRFEAIFKHDYAHQITQELLGITTENEFANLIACTIVQKYRFMSIDKQGNVEGETEYTQMLVDSINNNSFLLKAPVSRNYDLAKSLKYIFFGSGTITTLYKIKDIWGKEGINEILAYISDFLDVYPPNQDCQYWLQKNKSDYLKHYPYFDAFFTENASYVINYITKRTSIADD